MNMVLVSVYWVSGGGALVVVFWVSGRGTGDAARTRVRTLGRRKGARVHDGATYGRRGMARGAACAWDWWWLVNMLGPNYSQALVECKRRLRGGQGRNKRQKWSGNGKPAQ